MRLPSKTSTVAGRPFIKLGSEIAYSIMQTLIAAWELVRQSPGLNASAGEVEITEQVRDAMRNVLNSGQFPWSKTMIVLPGTESRSEEGMRIPDGRIDIPLLLIEIAVRHGEHDPHAIIECKRIAGSDSRLCREYVNEGIDRFKNRKYASNHSNGFMAGYVIAGDERAAVDGINSQLSKKSRSAEFLVPSNFTTNPYTPWLWQSCHPRRKTSSITLHHGLLRI